MLQLGRQRVRDRLRAEPLPPASASFAEREFGRSDLPDGRLRRRPLGLAVAWQQPPGLELPTLFPGEAERKAACRFLQPHREAMASRCRQQATVLLAQDDHPQLDAAQGQRAGAGPAQGAPARARR